ncbi:DUF2236 domain-containing protein [Acidiferrimicrobium sp. IK]|uniref:oxygenase MpaB family protein n=1 Tax=Acidiferrimicrobium sp. IK TaxID=2871700 RepID=UPI0021CB3DFF|nr:oxygenase MpaB family protein [Acidiferrimicrobium sp. IK]MCU4183915.1 DUF2236 domain-containing protein [Acidiferrimicrobium sp. IK]
MAPDIGLFGPGSVTWDVHSDPVSLLGGMRALLVQALNPLAMAGVDQHSDYRRDPWGRLKRTAQFVSIATYGTTEEAERIGAHIRAIHTRVHGVDTVTGRPYRADDPELLAWVHNVLVKSLLVAKQRYGGGLSAADADRYVAEMVKMAELVGTPVELVPTSVAGLRVYFRSAEMIGSPISRAAARTVLAPPIPARLRPVWAVLDAAAIGLLPRQARRLYGYPWVPSPAAKPVEAAFAALFGTAKLVLPPAPDRAAAEARLAARAAVAA